MQGTDNRRRFIAGAVCPRCSLMDKIVVNLDTDQRECVACGFSEQRPSQERPGQERPGQERPGQDSPGELATRVSRAAARRVETPAEVVKLLDPGSTADR
jgi:uncharacterized protein